MLAPVTRSVSGLPARAVGTTGIEVRHGRRSSVEGGVEDPSAFVAVGPDVVPPLPPKQAAATRENAAMVAVIGKRRS